MHVLLIQPSQFKGDESLLYGKLGSIDQPPMGLAMVAGALLAKGFEVDILDIDAKKASLEDVLKIIDKRKTRLAGLSITTPVFKNALRLCEQIKAQRPDVKTCLGGYHASMEPMECLEPQEIDFVVKGEGELTIVELACAVQEGATRDKLVRINGLFFKDQGVKVANPPRELIADLDTLPMPARHLLPNQNYTYPDTRYNPVFPVFTSRGCPGKCAFCQQYYVTGRKLRLRSPSKVADEIEHLIKVYRAREIHIWDDMFSSNPKHVFGLRDELKKRGIKIPICFAAGIRVDTATPEILQAMREMGGYSVAFGVESGVQEILDKCSKGITLEEARAAVRNAKRAGLETWCFFMLGLLGETKETVEQSIKFAIELDPDVVKFHIFKPYPGSDLSREMKAKGLILDFDVEKYGIHTYPVHRTEALSPEDIFRLQKEAYRRFYFRPRIILRQLLRLNSWARIKNNLTVAFGMLRLVSRYD